MRPSRLATTSVLLFALAAAPAAAQDPRGKPIRAPAGYLAGTAIYCDDGTNHAVPCSAGGGGGDPSSTGTPGSAPPATVAVQGLYDGAKIVRAAGDSSGRATVNVVSLPAVTGTVALTGSLPGFAAAPTVNLGTLNGAATEATLTTLLRPGGRVDTVIPSTSADRGATVGTSAVQLMAANAARRGFSVQNQSSSATCYVSGLAAATADYHSLMIAPGALYESKDSHTGTGALSIVCSAAATAVFAREW